MDKKSSVVLAESRNKEGPLYLTIARPDDLPSMIREFPDYKTGIRDVKYCDPLEFAKMFETYMDAEPSKKEMFTYLVNVNGILTGIDFDTADKKYIFYEFDHGTRHDAIDAIEMAEAYFKRVKCSRDTKKRMIEEAIKGPGFLMFRDY